MPRLNRDYLFQRTAKSARSSCFCDPPGRFFRSGSRISATDTCYATDKDDNAITVLDNREENTRGIVYSMALENGTVIYESGLIEPGEGIESPKLTEHLDPGTYNVIVTAQGHDVESHKAVGGTVSAQTTLVVK